MEPPSFAALDVPNFAPAAVALPDPTLAAADADAAPARPLVVVAHGWDDRPEGQCDVWRWITGGRAFVLCPRGLPVVGSPYAGFRYPGSAILANEIDAGIAALRARYGARIADGPILFAGFSLGAIFGVDVVLRDPARFPYVVLTEGGEDGWTLDDARRFHARGGKRVLFACGLKVRVATATSMAQRLVKGGVDAHVVLGKLPGKEEFMHWYNGPVADEIRAQLDWVVEGDARWAR